MATEAEQDMFRADLGDADESAFSDAQIDTIWERATAAASVSDDDLIFVIAKLIGIKQLMMQAAKRVTYKSGESSANLSDYFKHLKDLKKDLEAEQASLEKGLQSPIRLLGVNRIPREKSVP